MNIKHLSLALLLSACSLQPEYSRPEVNLPVSEAGRDEALPLAFELGWRQFFRDERLQQLISEALQHNHDLRKAAQQVQLAQAQYAIQDNLQLPTVGANASAGRSGNTGQAPERSAFQVGLGINQFELDFFGKTQSLKNQALERYLASREARDAAQLSVIKAVSKTYYQLQIARAQIELADDVLRSRQETLRLSRLQHQAGLLNEMALRGVESVVAQAETGLLTAERQQKQALHALSLLLGRAVSASEIPPASIEPSAFQPLRLPVLNADILQQRPDVRQAEHALKAAHANIGVARATMYPSLSLTTTLGLASSQLKDLFSSGFNWSVNSNLMAAIFDRDSLVRNLNIAEAQQEMALIDYQKALQSAFYEIANILMEQESLQRQWQVQLQAKKAVQKRLDLERLRFHHGVSSALELLDAQRERYSTAQALLNTQLHLLHRYVEAYISLGGGLIEQASLPALP